MGVFFCVHSAQVTADSIGYSPRFFLIICAQRVKVNHMKLLVLSDTHRSLGFAYDAIEKERPDAVLHLGDHLTDAEELSFACQEPDFYYVPGNCD